MNITSTSDGITIEGYIATWYVIDTKETPFGELFLLENELYGDEVPCLIVDSESRVLTSTAWNGFDDLEDVEVEWWVKDRVLAFMRNKVSQLRDKRRVLGYTEQEEREYELLTAQIDIIGEMRTELVEFKFRKEN